MTDGHTLIIPTYNRPALLKRLIEYYCKQAGPVNLLVLDSSKPEVLEENAKALAPHSDTVRHVVFPQSLPVNSKLARGLDLVQTPYASFCGDDDFVFPKGLREAVAFLAAHPDYVCVHGLYLNFRLAGHDVHLTSEYAGPGNEANHPGARIFRLLQGYESLFYGAFRTSDLRDIFVAIQALPTLHFQELFQSVATLIKGKVKRFPLFYTARQSGSPAESNREKWQTYYWFADNPVEILEHYRPYCEAVWKFYEAHAPEPRLERSAFFKTLDLAHAVYFSAGCPPEYFHSVLQEYWPADRYLKVGDVDQFDRLRSSAGCSDRTTARVLIVAGQVLRAVGAAPSLMLLNHNVRRACRNSWKCRLHLSLRWLTGVAEFRSAFLELCHYLDQS